MGEVLLPYANPVVPIDLGKWGMGEWCLRCPGFMRSLALIYWQSVMCWATVEVMASSTNPHLTSCQINDAPHFLSFQEAIISNSWSYPGNPFCCSTSQGSVHVAGLAGGRLVL